MRKPVLLLASILALASILTPTFAPAAKKRSPAPAPAPVVRETPKPPEPLPIKEIVLENGLRIFVLERPLSPTFAGLFQLGVGSATDPKGRSGIAHLLEHMMFKGTESIGTLDPVKERAIKAKLSDLWHALYREEDVAASPFRKADEVKIAKLKEEIENLTREEKALIVKNEYDELMTRAGGVAENAGTGNDTTTYFIMLPANRLEFWFRMESDRLLHPFFREFWSERDVVHEERRMGDENSPDGQAWEALMGLAFRAHPYGTPVIGWPRDIERLTEEDALSYFRTYYSPGNCVMTIVGDVKAEEVERLARKYLGSWERQELPRLPITDEPDQRGERRAVVEFDAEPSLRIAWRTVADGEPDAYPLQVLGSLLGGLSSSRMDRTLVQKERVATSVSAWQDSMLWGGYFQVEGQPGEGKTVADLEKGIWREIEKVKAAPPAQDELERAKIQTEAGRVRRLRSNLGQAFRIADAVTVSGGTDYIQEYERRLYAVTAGEVQRVALKYLTPSRQNVVEVRKVTGATKPSGEEGKKPEHRGGVVGTRGARHSSGFAEAMGMIRSAPPVAIHVPEVGKDVERTVLSCGTTVFLQEDHAVPSVEMAFEWTGGANTTPVAKLAPFSLASDLFNEGGTESLDPDALIARKEELGMSASFGFGDTEGSGRFWSLSRNFRESFDLAMEMLTRPRLDPKRLETIQGQFIDGMRRRWDYPGWGVYTVLNHVLNGDHPRLGYEPSRKEIEAVTPADVRAIWKRYLGRQNLWITAVGDFKKEEIRQLLEEKVCAWRDAEDAKREWITREPVVRPGVYLLEKDVSAPAIQVAGMMKLDRTAPLADHAALEIWNDILGGSGFRSRLMERVRSDEGLTYGIYSYIAQYGRPGVPGQIGIGWETGKTTVARSLRSTLEEVRKIVAEEVSPAEVEEQIDAWRNRFVFQFTNPFSSVERLMDHELDDMPYDWDRKLLAAVEAVTAEDVKRVAETYLRPGNLTITIFGTPAEEDLAEIKKDFPVRVLAKGEVFKGGFLDEEKKEGKKGEKTGN